MPQKKGAKGEKATKVKDLPAKSLKGKDAAKVKGGMMKSTVPDQYLKIEGLQAGMLLPTNLASINETFESH